VTKYPRKSTQKRKGLFWFPVSWPLGSVVHYDTERVVEQSYLAHGSWEGGREREREREREAEAGYMPRDLLP
jgi:hypothetical protein